jgi:hypothetical protein
MNMSKMQKKRSPLKEKPLRNPGDSLQEEIQRLIDDQLLPSVLTAVFVLMLAAHEWWCWLTSAPPQPVAVTLVACVFVAYAVYRYVSVHPQLRSLRLGREGEKSVGQFLEKLRGQGFHVFHDVPGHGFNIDHVVVAPQGVFAIETKTFSKPMKGEARVVQNGDRILVNGFEPDRSPVVQARAIRDWLDGLLLDATGRRYPMRGVVLLPGWWVEPSADNERTDIWVLNPKALPAFIAHEPVVLKEEDMALVSHRLTNHITRS